MSYRIFFTIVTAVSIISAVVISGPAIGAETVSARVKLAASDNYFEGILAIKEGHGDILVRPESGNDRRFKVTDNTTITRNGQTATYDDLRARDQLRVQYDSKRVVIELHATGS
jgi:hypothetical protein